MAYQKQDWYDLPNETTPISSERLNHIEQGIYDNSVNIGDLTQLDTTEKSNLVSAIKEVNGKLSKIETLYTGNIASGTATLNESIQNYDFILVVARGGGYTRGTTLIPVSLIEYGSTDETPWSVVVFQTSGVYASIKLNFTNATTISVTSYSGNWASSRVVNIIGIKL